MNSKKMSREDEAGDHGDAPTKDGQQNQTLGGRGVERILPRGLRRNQLHPHLVSTSASRTVGQFICCVGPRLWKCITAAEGNNARLPKEAPSKQRPEREEPRKDPREGSSQEPGKPVWSGGCAEWVSGRGGQGQGQLVQSLQIRSWECVLRVGGSHRRALGRELCSRLPLERPLWKLTLVRHQHPA